MTKTKHLALYGMLTALALVLGYVEAMIPALFAVPGMKLGLTNLVVLVALYRMDTKSAVCINGIRIVLTSILFGTAVSFLYSLAGGLLSGAGMIALRQTGKFQPVTVSILGGVLHNVGQILVAMFVLRTNLLIYYLPFLIISGVVAGIIIGLLGNALIKRLKDIEF